MYSRQGIFFLFTFLLFAIQALAAPRDPDLDPPKQKSREELTDILLFKNDLPTFLAHKKAKAPKQLIWTDDGCSVIPDWYLKNVEGLDYNPACKRHDFGYANYEAQKRCSEDQRGKIDNKLLSDLKDYCNARYKSKLQIIMKGKCHAGAQIVYKGVRLYGKKYFC